MAGMENYDVSRQSPPLSGGLILLSAQTDNGTMIYKRSANTNGLVPVTRPVMVDEVAPYNPEVSGNASA